MATDKIVVSRGHRRWQQRWRSAGDNQRPTIYSRHWAELVGPETGPQTELPPWRPGNGKQAARRPGGALARHLPLDDEIGSDQRYLRVVEEPMEDSRGRPERRAGKHTEWPFRQRPR